MAPYYTLSEVSEQSAIPVNQILRLAMSGTIILSVLENLPKNYEEVEERENPDGSKSVTTRTKETVLLIRAEKKPPLSLRYIATEDVINVVVNEAPNRKTLVRALYDTRDLDPAKGKYFVNSALRISQCDLLLAEEEWHRLQGMTGKQKRTLIPLATPEKVSLSWLARNMPIEMYWKASVIVVSVFIAGMYFSDSPLHKRLAELFHTASNAETIGKSSKVDESDASPR